MAKLKLTAEPTFKTKVGIPVPGAKPAEIEFTFRHKTRAEATAWIEQPAGEDADALMQIVVGWELDDEFNRENMALLCDQYGGASREIVNVYLRELAGTRAKN